MPKSSPPGGHYSITSTVVERRKTFRYAVRPIAEASSQFRWTARLALSTPKQHPDAPTYLGTGNRLREAS